MTEQQKIEWYRAIIEDRDRKISEQQAALVEMREHFQIALEHWEMYEEQFADVEREAFDKASSALESSAAGEATAKRIAALERVANYAKYYRKESLDRPINETSSEFFMRKKLDNALAELEAMEK